jgi:ribose/xylose/arabinose/galactoside ABC-type transport system permease subunit
MKSPTARFISGVLITAGVFFWLLLPFGYWLIHGSYERYIWLIGGPAPFGQLGSAPVQLWLDIILVAAGFTCIIVGIILLRKKNSAGN